MGDLKPLEAPTKAQIHAICILSPYFRELKYNQWQIAGHISNALAESLKLNGPDFFSELMPIVHRALASQYYGEANPFSIWRNVYKKASRLAEQKIKALPKPIHKTMEELLVKNTSESFT